MEKNKFLNGLKITYVKEIFFKVLSFSVIMGVFRRTYPLRIHHIIRLYSLKIKTNIRTQFTVYYFSNNIVFTQ